MSTNNVSLRIGGVDWQGWKQVTVIRQVDAIAGQFSLDLADRWYVGAEALPLAPGLECELLCGNESLINGYIDEFNPSFSTTEHAVSVTGRDRSADMVDCSAVHKPGQWKGLTVGALAKILAAPFKVFVTVEGAEGKPFDVFKLEQGETAFAALDRALKQRELLAMPDAKGGFILAEIGKKRCGTALEQGKNILLGSARYNAKDRFGEYVVQGQMPGSDDVWGDKVAQVSAGAVDPGVKRYRPHIIRAENQVNGVSAKARADWECTVRAARAVTVEVTVRGWRTGGDGGEIWPINALAPVNIPYLRIEQDLLISKATYIKGMQGTITRLELRDPKSFLADPAKKAAKKGADTWGSLSEQNSATAQAAQKKQAARV